MSDAPLTPAPQAGSPRSAWFYLWRAGVALVLLIVLAVVGLLLYASTPQFSDMVRKKVVAVLEDSTGGRVELQSFHWSLLRLAVTAGNLTIHGLEGPGETPYAHFSRLYVRIRVLSFLRPKIALDYLEADHPVFHLIVYPDGSTNQPRPRRPVESNRSFTDTIFDLQAQRVEADQGLVLINQRAIPFNLAANNLRAVVTYSPAKDRYLGSLQVADLDLQRDSMPALSSRLTLDLELARTAATLKALHFASGGSELDASGSIASFAGMQWKLAAQGSVDVREVAALTGINGLRRGTASFSMRGEGAGFTQYSIGGNLRLVDAGFQTSYLTVSGASATTSFSVTPEEIALNNLSGRLREGGGADATVRFLHWNAPVAPSGPTPARGSRGVTRGAAVVPIAGIHARVYGVRLPAIMRMVAPFRYRNLGFDTAVDGNVDVNWTGSGEDLTVAARVRLTAPRSRLPGQAPVTGLVDAKYFQRGGKVQINQLDARTPASNVQVAGILAVYPVTASSKLQVHLTTGNLKEFDSTLTDLGLAAGGKKGVAAIPVELSGQGEFTGAVGGSLLNPDVQGHLTATDFSTEFALGRNISPPALPEPYRAGPAGPGARASSFEKDGAARAPQAPVREIHWDRLDAAGEYSPALISIQHATLTGGGARIDVQGRLEAHRISAKRAVFDNASAINATAGIHQASLADLMAIAGESLPVSGKVNLQAHVGGSLSDLNGEGEFTIGGGEIEGEPYHSIAANLTFAGSRVNLEKLTVLQDGGILEANGNYDLASKTFQARLAGSRFELAHIHRLRSAGIPATGSLNFDAQASGTLEAPSIALGLHLTNATLAGQPIGGFEASAHTQGDVLTFTARSTLRTATFDLTGQTVLRDPFQTKARLAVAGLELGPLLEKANNPNLTGHSVIDGTLELAGPAKDPKQLSGSAEIDHFSATLDTVTISSLGPLRASIRDGELYIAQAHIVGPNTDMTVSGSAGLLGDRKLNLNAGGSVNVKLAETFDPDITSSGRVDFTVQAAGSMRQPLLTGQLRLADVAISLDDVPTGISKLNGTLVFDQDRLEVQNLTGMTGGGQLKLGGFITYKNGVYGNLTATGKDIRVRYSGVSATADTALQLQGTESNLLLSGNVQVTRFIIGPTFDFAVFAGGPAAIVPPNPNAPSNRVRLDVHVTSSPQLDFQNSYAQLAGSVDLRIRGTVAQPTVLGRINITEGTANFAGTTYQLQHGSIYFTNPVRIDPVIDIDASTRIEEYDVTVGLHGNASHLSPAFRSDPPLPQADVISLLALGRTQQEQQLYSQEEEQAGANPMTNALLGGALNAAVASRMQRLFGVGSVKIDPTYIGNLGNSTARITVQQNISRNVQLTYATNVNTTAEQLIQAQVNLTENVSVLAIRDEAGVFSMVLKVHKRAR